MDQQHAPPGRTENVLGRRLGAAGSVLIGIAFLLLLVLLAFLPNCGLAGAILGGSLGCIAVLLVGLSLRVVANTIRRLQQLRSLCARIDALSAELAEIKTKMEGGKGE